MNSRTIQIRFERGGTFTAELLDKDAPKTCKAILDKLPIDLEVRHVKSSGDAIFGYANFTIEPENQQAIHTAGIVGFLPRNPAKKIPERS